MNSHYVDFATEEDELFFLERKNTTRTVNVRRIMCSKRSETKSLEGNVVGQSSHCGKKKAQKLHRKEMLKPIVKDTEEDGDTTAYFIDDVLKRRVEKGKITLFVK